MIDSVLLLECKANHHNSDLKQVKPILQLFFLQMARYPPTSINETVMKMSSKLWGDIAEDGAPRSCHAARCYNIVVLPDFTGDEMFATVSPAGHGHIFHQACSDTMCLSTKFIRMTEDLSSI